MTVAIKSNTDGLSGSFVGRKNYYIKLPMCNLSLETLDKFLGPKAAADSASKHE